MEKREIEYFVRNFELIPSDGGRFEFEVNGEMLFSKKQAGRHAEDGEIEGLMIEYIKQYATANGIPIPEFN